MVYRWYKGKYTHHWIKGFSQCFSIQAWEWSLFWKKNPTSSNIAFHCIVISTISFKVYITFVFIVVFASLVVLSKICIYDWWMKGKVRYKDLLSHILWMWLSGTGGWYIYTSCAGNIQQHPIHWNGLHPKWFHWVSFSVEKNWWWVINKLDWGR